LKAAGIEGRFTVHGLRRTFVDLSRRAGIDPVTSKSLTGHVTEKMREHYSSVDLEEKRTAVGKVVRLVVNRGGGDRSGDQESGSKKADSEGQL
jgi:integrase